MNPSELSNEPSALDPNPVFDVVVVRGGLAGPAAALGLAWARRSVLVVDAGHSRNEAAGHAHG